MADENQQDKAGVDVAASASPPQPALIVNPPPGLSLSAAADMKVCRSPSYYSISLLILLKKRRRDEKAAPPTPKKVTTFKANCTHMIVERVYGEDYCHVCFRYPSMGWLYRCKQDEQFANAPVDRSAVSGNPAEVESKSELRTELEKIGLSESVIKAAEDGHYTELQLERIKAQKMQLKMVIALELASAAMANAAAEPVEAGPPNTDGTHHSLMHKHKAETQDVVSSIQHVECHQEEHQLTLLQQVEEHRVLTCAFLACHTCRPYFKDRIYMSMETAFSPSTAPLTLAEANELPVNNAVILRDILLRVPLIPTPFQQTPDYMSAEFPDQVSDSTGSTQSTIDPQTHDRLGRRRFYKLGARSSSSIVRNLRTSNWRESLKTTFRGMFKSNTTLKKRRIEDHCPGDEAQDESSSDDTRNSRPSNITLPLPHTGTHRDIQQQPSDFDINLLKRVSSARRKTMAAEQSLYQQQNINFQASSSKHTVANGHAMGSSFSGSCTASPAVDSGPSTDYSPSTSNSSVYSFYTGAASAGSENGDEVVVEGGVALTEEAVETHVPDIIKETVPVVEKPKFDDDSIITQA